MYELELHLNKIHNEKMDAYQWGRYWNDFKRWAYLEGNYSGESIYLSNAKIKSYLNVPLLAPFFSVKEEVAKFILIHYHKDKFWLPELVDITPKLISYIRVLPTSGDLVPIT